MSRDNPDIESITVRRSDRSRRLQLRVSPYGKVELVAPRAVSDRVVRQFILRHQEWLDRTLAQVEHQRRQNPETFAEVPARIDLAGLNEVWLVDWLRGEGSTRLRVNDSRRVIHLVADDPVIIRQRLRQWLDRRARESLTSWVLQLSQQHNLPVNKISVRSQKTRWGSCSARKNISLNRNLLFLKPEQIEYLLIHELCHTVHMNHSPAYWKKVSELSPDYQGIDKSLRHGFRQVPLWALTE